MNKRLIASVDELIEWVGATGVDSRLKTANDYVCKLHEGDHILSYERQVVRIKIDGKIKDLAVWEQFDKTDVL